METCNGGIVACFISIWFIFLYKYCSSFSHPPWFLLPGKHWGAYDLFREGDKAFCQNPSTLSAPGAFHLEYSLVSSSASPPKSVLGISSVLLLVFPSLSICTSSANYPGVFPSSSYPLIMSLVSQIFVKLFNLTFQFFFHQDCFFSPFFILFKCFSHQ